MALLMSPVSTGSSPKRVRTRRASTESVGFLKDVGMATAMQWGSFVPPPVPRCSEVIPKHLLEWKKEARILRRTLHEEEYEHHDRHRTGGDIRGFRSYLRHRYGSAAKGWRLDIAPHGDVEAHDFGKLGTQPTSFSDFIKGLKKIGFPGNAGSLWSALNTGNGSVYLEDLDPALGDMLDIIAETVADRYPGGSGQAWLDVDHEHRLRVTLDEFDRFLFDRENGLLEESDPVNSSKVYECLCISGQNTLSQEEFTFLDHWAFRRKGHPVPQRCVVTSPDEGIIAHPSYPDLLCIRDDPDYHHANFSAEANDLGTIVSTAASARETVYAIRLDKNGLIVIIGGDGIRILFKQYGQTQKELGTELKPRRNKKTKSKTLADFRIFLEEKFLSPARAWRVAMDVKATGYLSPSEFGMACRQMGWHHPHLQIWHEIREAGGSVTANLRGLDPVTCSAIDALIEQVMSSCGDLHIYWSTILDPDGDGICSRSEFLAFTRKAMDVSTKTLARIFLVLDTTHVGWVAASELSFLDAFVPSGTEAEAPQATMSSIGSGGSMRGMSDRRNMSMSTGSLLHGRRGEQSDQSFAMTDMSWMSSSWEAGASASTSLRSTSLQKAPIDSTQRSSRTGQYRSFAKNHEAKHRFLKDVTATKHYSLGDSSPWAVLQKDVLPKMPKIGGHPASDAFRSTSEFYREGMRLMQLHHEREAARAEEASRRHSPSSSRRGGSSKSSSKRR